MDNLTDDVSLRSGAVWSPVSGCLISGDDEADADDLAHTLIFWWREGQAKLRWRDLDWTAHTICTLPSQQDGAVIAGFDGRCFVVEGQSEHEEHLLGPSPGPRDAVTLRSLRRIGDAIFAVGMNGLVRRRFGRDDWRSVGPSLPLEAHLEAIDGFGATELYAVGANGGIWSLINGVWRRHETPTNVILIAVCCAPDGTVYVCGQDGIILRGRGDIWDIVDQDLTEEDLWSVAVFSGRIYFASLGLLYALNEDGLVAVDFGSDMPTSCYHLSTTADVMWSIGRKDLLALDGVTWRRIY